MADLTFIKDLAKRAGKIISDSYDAVKTVNEKESYADLATDSDMKVENFLKTEILSTFPTHKFIAEEGYQGSAVLTDEPTWIIDPIDGTSNFVSSFPFIAVSIAHYVGGEARLATVYNPILKCFYCAEKGKGACRNGLPIKTSNLKDLSKALVLTDWGGDRNPENLDRKSNNMRRIITRARGVRTMGSAALHMCQIAAGSGDIFYEFGIHCWDYAAATLIVREAGGYCCNYDGSPVDLLARNVICAASPELAQSLRLLIEPIDYPRD